jgi:HSP20 family protein
MDDFFRHYSPKIDLRAGSLFDKEGYNIAEWSPTADISETKKEYLVKAEIPDVDKKDIHVSVREGTLTIEGERKHTSEKEGETYHRVESVYGKFSRSFALPADIDESLIKADYRKGVLHVHLQKTRESPAEKAVEIEIT